MEVELIIFVKSFFEAINNKCSERVLEEGSIQGLRFFFFFVKFSFVITNCVNGWSARLTRLSHRRDAT